MQSRRCRQRTNVVGDEGVLELALLADLGLEVNLVVDALLVELNDLVVAPVGGGRKKGDGGGVRRRG